MRQRNLIFVTVMSIITFGIYDLYWAFSTRDELRRKHLDVPTPWIVLAPLLGLIIVALLQIITHLVLSSSGTFSNSGTAILNVISVLVGILAVLGIIPMMIYWVWKYSKAVEVVTNQALTAELSFVIALVTSVIGFSFIWPIFVQYHYNQIK